MSEYGRAADAARVIRPLLPGRPDVAVVVGSGLGALTGVLEAQVALPYDRIPHWPAAGVAGHEGRLVAGEVAGRVVIALSGRTHAYESHDLAPVVFGMRVLGQLGVPVAILTGAAGGIRDGLTSGSLLVVDDHLNLAGRNPLVGANDDRFGPRFPDMTHAYSPRLREAADRAGRDSGLDTPHGIYAWVTGPSYETPAEVRFLRGAGADVVGMSIVPETIVARHMGIEVLAVACVTNPAAGLHQEVLDHASVLVTARRAGERLAALVPAVIARL